MHVLLSLGIVFSHYNQTNSQHFTKYTAIPNVIPGILFVVVFFSVKQIVEMCLCNAGSFIAHKNGEVW